MALQDRRLFPLQRQLLAVPACWDATGALRMASTWRVPTASHSPIALDARLNPN
ncbi:hypothetical protein ACIRPX_43020 [Streptomyces sp. NPDC101225]|uniref:hypothetical protein n=1 Tax=Streptomyces sp. NPDC101225 TaxID=3366135 RepID=UPI003800E9A0